MSTASKTTTAKPKKGSASKQAPAPVPAESATPAPAQPKPQSSYFNLHIDGLGYLSNIREVNTATGSFLSCTINALPYARRWPVTSILRPCIRQHVVLSNTTNIVSQHCADCWPVILC